MALPYVRPAYNDQQATARMSDLIRARGVSQAEADRRQAAISVGMWGNVIQTAGSTMADLAKIQAEKPTQDLRKAQTQRALREERKAFEGDEIGRQGAGMTPAQQAEIARGYGREDLAQQYETDALTLEEKHLKLEELKGKRIGDEFAKAGDVIRLAMSPEMPGEKKQALWSEGRTRLGKALDLMPEDLASIPETVPTDPKQLSNYLEMTMTARERVEAQSQAARALNESRKDDDAYSKYLSTYVAAAQNAGEFNAVRDLAQRRGKGDLFDTVFGQTYTPEAVDFAKRTLGKGDKPDMTPTAGQDAQGTGFFQVQPDGSMKRMPGARPIPPRETGGADAGGSKPVSQPQRAEALARKTSALKELEKTFAETLKADESYTPGVTAPKPEALQLLNYGKLKIENNYREALGLPAVESLDEAGYGRSDGRAMSALAKPAAPAALAVATAPASVAPSQAAEVALRTKVEALQQEIVALERAGKKNTPVYNERLRAYRTLIGG